MFHGIFFVTLLPLIIQLFLLSNVFGIDPNFSDPLIPTDLTQNVAYADTAPSPNTTLMDNGEFSESESEPSGNSTILENAGKFGSEAEDQLTTGFSENEPSGNATTVENVGTMVEEQPTTVSEHERFGNATTLENAENVDMAEDQPTIVDNSLLTRMLGMDEKLELSIENEVEENQRQLMDDGTMDSSVEEGEMERKRVPLQANADGGADQNANGNENKMAHTAQNNGNVWKMKMENAKLKVELAKMKMENAKLKVELAKMKMENAKLKVELAKMKKDKRRGFNGFKEKDYEESDEDDEESDELIY